MAIAAAPKGGYVPGAWYWDNAVGDARQWDGKRFGNPGEVIMGNGKTSEPTSSSGSSNPLDQANQSIIDAYQKVQDTVNTKGKEFDKNNPFAFDEALATQKTIAKQQLDPYYEQTLGDFLSGIETQRSRGVEDNNNLLTELGANQDIFNKKTQQNATLATENANETAADSGMYGSGKQLRTAGLIKSGANQEVQNYGADVERKKAQAALGIKRTNEDLALEEKQKRRALTQEESYNVNTQALGETGNLQKQREFAKAQYVGASPGVNPLDYSSYTYKLLGA